MTNSKECVMDSMHITLDELEAEFVKWEEQMRAGVCMDPKEAALLPVEEVAKQCAAHVFGLLKDTVPA